MKRALIILFLLTVVICCVCGCTSNATVLEFTYSDSDCSDEKSLYFNENRESVTLNGKIEIDSGTAVMQIFEKESNKLVWEKSTDKTEEFDIELNKVTANTEYIFSIKAEHVKYLHLIVTSPEKLVKDKDKPIAV